MQFIVLAAGKGTRMLPLTATRSKAMIPVANRPFIDWFVERLPGKDVVVVVNREQGDLISHLKENNIGIAYQAAPQGSGDALRAAEEHAASRFVAINGDEFFSRGDIAAVAKQQLAVTGREVADVSLFGSLRGDSALEAIEEKAATGKGLANCGLYALDERIFAALRAIKKSPRGEYELVDAVNALAKEADVRIHRASEWHTLSCPWNILDINELILKEKGDLIDESAELRSGAVLESPVAIGAESVVGPNCFVRAFSSVGARCKIGQAVEIKNSVIMDNSYVSHLSYVGDSVVGANCNIAASTVFANLRLDEKNVKIEINGRRVDSGRKKLGGIVGDGVKFGTGVTVMPGKRIWPSLLIPPRSVIDEDIREQPPVGYGKNG